MVFNDLLLPSPDLKKPPGKRDLFLAGIAIPGTEIPCLTGNEETFNYPSPSLGTGIDLLVSTK
jgi:hypothetical protein